MKRHELPEKYRDEFDTRRTILKSNAHYALEKHEKEPYLIGEKLVPRISYAVRERRFLYSDSMLCEVEQIQRDYQTFKSLEEAENYFEHGMQEV